VSAGPAFGGPGPLLLVLAAMALDGGLGTLPLPFRVGPRALAGLAGREFDRRLNRIERGDTTRLIRGALVVLVMVAAAWIAGLAVSRLGRVLAYGWVLDLTTLVACLSLRRPWERVRAVRKALETGGAEAGRLAVRLLTRREPDTCDEHGIARTAIEAVARAFNQSVVAPGFWYILAGLPGLLVWVAVDTLDEVIGHRSPRYEHFGLTAARLDDALNFLPARLAGLVLAVSAAFVGSAQPVAALRTMLRDARYSPSLNGGWPVAAVAGALGLALAGPYREGGVTVRAVWLGQGRARATPADINRALALYAVACLVFAGLIGLLMAGLAAA
jgi:adenosylcobinamide-phosphate synthase